MRELVARYLSRSISRRGFLKGLTTAGISLASAEAIPMALPRKLIPGVLLSALLLPGAAQAQRAKPAGFPDGPGKDVLVAKCFQCHAPTMWQDHRQDRRGWESVLYRMVGRGALWTEEEINTMADYLAKTYGRQPVQAAK